MKQKAVEEEKIRVKRERAVKQFVASFDQKEDLHCHVCAFSFMLFYNFTYLFVS